MKEARAANRVSFTNHYFMTPDIERYIALGRMYYENVAGGILFIFDEEKFYRVCLYVDAAQPFGIPALDKKALIRNIYRTGQKPASWNALEDNLLRNGFCRTDVVLQAQVDCAMAVQNGGKIEKYKQMLCAKGYQCVAADESMLGEAEALIRDAAQIKEHHLDYRSDAEKCGDLKNGAYLCIVDGGGHICAASVALVKNDMAYGAAIAVEEPYQMSGFAPVLSYERCRRLSERGIRFLAGWILEDNEASIKHHKSMGYTFTGHCADEWILEAKQ